MNQACVLCPAFQAGCLTDQKYSYCEASIHTGQHLVAVRGSFTFALTYSQKDLRQSFSLPVHKQYSHNFLFIQFIVYL